MFLEEKRCAICGKSEEYVNLDKHHVIKRSTGGTDEDTIYLCRECHNWAEHNIDEAEKLGLHKRVYKLNKQNNGKF